MGGALIGVLLVACLVAGFLAVTYVVKHRIPLLTDTEFKAASNRWSETLPDSYTMEIQIGGNQPGVVQAVIQHQNVVSLSRNGKPITQERIWEYWTVPFLLNAIGEDLETQQNPQQKAERFKVSPGTDMTLRAEFDPVFGYPTRYRRTIAGTNQEIEWSITRFEKMLVGKESD